METAAEWGITPFAFWALPDMERAIMLAHYREKRLRKAHVDHAQNKILDKKSKDKGSSMPDQHAAFFGA